MKCLPLEVLRYFNGSELFHRSLTTTQLLSMVKMLNGPFVCLSISQTEANFLGFQDATICVIQVMERNG